MHMHLCEWRKGMCTSTHVFTEAWMRHWIPLKLDFQVVVVQETISRFPTRAGGTQSLSYLSSTTTHIHTTIRIIAVNSWVATFPRQREADFMSYCGVSTHQPLLAISSTAVSPKWFIWGTHLFYLNKTVLTWRNFIKTSTVLLLIMENYLNKP